MINHIADRKRLVRVMSAIINFTRYQGERHADYCEINQTIVSITVYAIDAWWIVTMLYISAILLLHLCLSRMLLTSKSWHAVLLLCEILEYWSCVQSKDHKKPTALLSIPDCINLTMWSCPSKTDWQNVVWQLLSDAVVSLSWTAGLWHVSCGKRKKLPICTALSTWNCLTLMLPCVSKQLNGLEVSAIRWRYDFFKKFNQPWSFFHAVPLILISMHCIWM